MRSRQRTPPRCGKISPLPVLLLLMACKQLLAARMLQHKKQHQWQQRPLIQQWLPAQSSVSSPLHVLRAPRGSRSCAPRRWGCCSTTATAWQPLHTPPSLSVTAWRGQQRRRSRRPCCAPKPSAWWVTSWLSLKPTARGWRCCPLHLLPTICLPCLGLQQQLCGRLQRGWRGSSKQLAAVLWCVYMRATGACCTRFWYAPW
mmetsp:Transcript_24482/g.53490  ORF Transcript_24482/g.53490 Transcript_24482/m.53490 type:complete len:201 (-) Transcript_24482:530-1132(-)